MKKHLLLTLVWWTSSLLGSSLPFPPPTDVLDKVLFGKESPKAFFAERARSNPKCVQTLSQTKKDWQLAVQALTDAIEKKAPKGKLLALEEASTTARHSYHDHIAQCGHCAIRPIEKKKVVSAGGTAIWYAVNGSCWLPGEADTFATRTQSLKNSANYPAYSGGYPQIYEFVEIDSSTAAVLPAGPLPNKFQAYMAIRGPVLFQAPTAFDYSMAGELTSTTDSFVFDFQAIPTPRRLRPPRVYEHLASGEKRRVRLLHLKQVQGKWILTRDGSLRFFMAADLRMDLDFAKKVARRTLLDSLVHLSQIGVSK